MLTQFYTFAEVCKALKISPNTLRSRLASGEITGRKVGAQWRFTEEDLNRQAQRNDGIDATSTITPIILHRRPTPHRTEKGTFRERLKADGYI